MKNVKSFFALCFFLVLSITMAAQNGGVGCQDKSFSNCTAVFLNNKMLVDEYSPRGKCKIEEGMAGKMIVSTVNMSFDSIEPFKNAGFKIAIKNERTNTLWLFSEETFYEIDVEKVLAKCQNGDKIILLTVDKEFSLPHNEIDIVWGC